MGTTNAMKRADALDLEKSRPQRFSMSLVRGSGECLLSCRFGREANVGGEAATLGSIWHDMASVVGEHAILTKASRVEPVEAVALAQRAVERPAEAGPLSFAHYETALALIEKWAATMSFGRADQTRRAEAAFRDVLADSTGVDRVISARIDWLTVDGAAATIDDYKTGGHLPPQAEFEGPDWTLNRPQLVHYAWHVFRQFPQVETVVGTERYVRYGVGRSGVLTRDDAARYERYLRAAVTRIVRAWDAGEFPATPGTWCAWCAMPDRCPLPESVRPASAVRTMEQAEAQAAARAVEQERSKRRDAALKGFLDRDAAQTVSFGDKERGWVMRTERRLDKARLDQTGLNLDEYKTERTSVTWTERRRKS